MFNLEKNVIIFDTYILIKNFIQATHLETVWLCLLVDKETCRLVDLYGDYSIVKPAIRFTFMLVGVNFIVGLAAVFIVVCHHQRWLLNLNCMFCSYFYVRMSVYSCGFIDKACSQCFGRVPKSIEWLPVQNHVCLSVCLSAKSIRSLLLCAAGIDPTHLYDPHKNTWLSTRLSFRQLCWTMAEPTGQNSSGNHSIMDAVLLRSCVSQWDQINMWYNHDELMFVGCS